MTGILAIDQGTTATKALIMSPEGEVESFASARVQRYYPQAGWVEQDAVELWESVLAAVGQLPRQEIIAIGVASQRESVLVWDRRTGHPLTPCISWQCTRGAGICAALRADGVEDLVWERTGLPLGPMFSASKLSFLLASDPSLRAAAESGTALAGTIDSWLAWNLSGGALHVTDAGNASRTMLLDTGRLRWDTTLLELFKVPSTMLAAVVATSGLLGEAVPQGGLPRAPIAALAADSHAAMYGLGCTQPGTAKATYGTGTSLASPTGRERIRSNHGLASSVAWLGDGPTYALEGNVLSSGATVDWVGRLLGLDTALAVEKLARTVPGAGGVHVVPGFAGLGAPYWRPEARGQISGLTFGTGPAELARAAIESIAFQVADLVTALEQDTHSQLEQLRADGGATSNDVLMQFQADLLGRPVIRAHAPDAAAMGAAYLAAIAVGAMTPEQVAVNAGTGEVIEPRMTPDRRGELRANWRRALMREVDAPVEPGWS
jgi:glycerol kinase